MVPRHQQRRDTTNEYAALFVALIGEGPNPLGVVNTSEGKVVRAFHRFTLVDQTGQGRDLTKGRTRDVGAVKISCARQDPNARNCHGYRKFVKRSILEDPARGYLANDTIIIKYTIELVVSSGGALSRNGGLPKPESIKVGAAGRGATAGPRRRTTGASRLSLQARCLQPCTAFTLHPHHPLSRLQVPQPSIGRDLGQLLYSGNGADYTIAVEYTAPAGAEGGGRPGGGDGGLAEGPTSSQMAGGEGAVVKTTNRSDAPRGGGGGGGGGGAEQAQAQASGGSTGGGGGAGGSGGGDETVTLQEEFKVHRMILEARSPYFQGLLGSSMAEAREGRLVIRELLPPVVRAVLHFIYTGARAGGGACLGGRPGLGRVLQAGGKATWLFATRERA
jgi:hypothetical protein